MNGQPAPSRAELARSLALLQPKLIADRLFADSTFLTEFGVASGQAISFGGGPAILKKALYDGVRALFTDQQPQALAALTGEGLALSLAADAVAISFAPEGGDPITAHSLNLKLLSPESKI